MQRLAPFQQRAYTYKVTTAPVNLAVSLDTVKSHLKITGTSEDALLTIYIQAATDVAEKLTRRDFITRTYQTFRDFFLEGISEGYYQFGDIPSSNTTIIGGGGNTGFELRKSPLQSVESIKYLKAAIETPVAASVFYNTVEEDYSEVLTLEDQNWPTDADRRLQAITIEFKTGFGDDDADMPAWVTEGILQHVAELYSNRGDCSCEADVMGALPSVARLIYLQNRIENL